ncbi:hypothetical protein ACO0OE_000537 [Hanseniaspora uvarum]
MNPLVSNIGVMLLSNYICKRLDMTDPKIIDYLRIFYVSMNALTYLIYSYIKLQIKKQNNLTTIKYKNQKSPVELLFKGGKEEDAAADAEIVKTVVDYDLEQVDALLKGFYTSWLMMAGMHLYMKYTQPLVQQGISPIKACAEHDLFKAYVLGQEVQRPFGQQQQPEAKKDDKPKKKLPAVKKD